jgi:manganese efflux pump family protein
MNILMIVIIAISLSMDALAISITTGASCKKPQFHNALRIALAFGIFQAVMPVLGWLAGWSVLKYISSYDHWIAFGLLSFVGGKMIYESFKIQQKQTENLSNTMLLFLAFATSIDALAVGFTFSLMLAQNLLIAITIIGVITFVICYAGFYIGNRIGHFFESKIEALGGLILIAIGLKILLEHLLKP